LLDIANVRRDGECKHRVAWTDRENETTRDHLGENGCSDTMTIRNKVVYTF